MIQAHDEIVDVLPNDQPRDHAAAKERCNREWRLDKNA